MATAKSNAERLSAKIKDAHSAFIMLPCERAESILRELQAAERIFSAGTELVTDCVPMGDNDFSALAAALAAYQEARGA